METAQVLQRLVTTGQLAEANYQTLTETLNRDIKSCTEPLIEGDIATIKATIPSAKCLIATSSVFNTAELVEEIFVNLDAPDLLFRVQLVCKGFKKVVGGSPRLARILFRQPDHVGCYRGFPFELDGTKIYAVSWGNGKLLELNVFTGLFSWRKLARYPALLLLLVSQPPMTEFNVEVTWNESKGKQKFKPQEGEALTFRFLDYCMSSISRTLEKGGRKRSRSPADYEIRFAVLMGSY
jgi:hypothetical protein